MSSPRRSFDISNLSIISNSLVILLTSVCFCGLSFAQHVDMKFEHITIENGLPENTVQAILQDHQGFLWLGTQNGLVQYDGYTMAVYQPEQGNPNSISHRQIRAIYQDKSGTLWIGTGIGKNGGLNRFNRSRGTFFRYLHNPEDSTSLSHNYVSCIYEDRSGRLWVGTSQGLNRLDRPRNRFQRYYFQAETYRPAVYEYLSTLGKAGKNIAEILEVGNNANLTQTFILEKTTAVLIAMMGEVTSDYGWLEDKNGDIILRFNPNENRFAGGRLDFQAQIRLDTLEAGKYRLRYVSDINNSYSDKWLGKRPFFPEHWGIQVFSLTKAADSVRTLLTQTFPVPIPTMTFAITEDQRTGNLYAGINNAGLWLIDTERRTFLKPDFPDDQKLNSAWIKSFHQARDGKIWLGTSIGLFHLNLTNGGLKHYQTVPSETYVRSNDILSVIESQSGRIYGATNRGLLEFDPKTERIRHHRNKFPDPDSLHSNRVWAVHEDRSGILWVGTRGGGLNKWDRKKWKMNNFQHHPDNLNSLSHNAVQSVFADRSGMVWLGTFNGLNKFDRTTGAFKRYRYGPPDIRNNAIQSICRDSAGVLWLGTQQAGLARFDPDRETFSFYSHDPQDSASISHNDVQSICMDRQGVLWAGTFGGGLNQFNRESGTFTRFQHDPDDPASLSQNQVSIVYEDRSGTLWIGTNLGGLNRFDRKKRMFIRHHSISGERDFAAAITAICEDRQGNFWIGTNFQGIYLFDRDTGSGLNYAETDGLANNGVWAILEDNSGLVEGRAGNIWISTRNGLSKLNPHSGDFKNYGVLDGLGGADFNLNSASKSLNGEMFFGGRNGFNVFHPDSLRDDPVPPQVVLTNLTLFNRPDEALTFEKHISESDEVRLLYDQNDLYFEFVALHYSEPEKNSYAYMLENYNNLWIDLGTRRNVSFTNLDPGDYVFRVKAANRDGVWNDKGALLKIIIAPPWWRTTWAYLLYIGLTISAIFAFISFRTKQLKQRSRELEKTVAERTREIHRQQEQLIVQEKLASLGQLTAGIAHEIKNPLNFVNNFAELSEDLVKELREEFENQKDKLDKDTIRYLQEILDDLEHNSSKINHHGKRADGIVQGMLAHSRGKSGEFQEVDINELLEEYVNLAYHGMRARNPDFNVTIEKVYDDSISSISVEPQDLSRVFLNLINNAFDAVDAKFGSKGGDSEIPLNPPSKGEITPIFPLEEDPGGMSPTVKVSTKKHPNQIEIRIRDNGTGIPEDIRKQIFNPFFTTKPTGQGNTGLGLSISFDIITKVHRGELKVETEIGKFTEFIIRIPKS